MRLDKNKIFILRAKKQWDLKDIAEAAGVTAQAVGHALKRNSVSAPLAGKIAEALEVDVEEILIKED